MVTADPAPKGRAVAPPPPAPGAPAIANRDWILDEFVKGIEAEAARVARGKLLTDSPPDPTLGSLYREMTEADERHREIVERVAIRYGATPSRGLGGGLQGLVDRVKAMVSNSAKEPHQQVANDLTEKANAIHWYIAWIATFRSIGDEVSVVELTDVLREESDHRDRLQEALNELVRRSATMAPPVTTTEVTSP